MMKELLSESGVQIQEPRALLPFDPKAHIQNLWLFRTMKILGLDYIILHQRKFYNF
jgi:hypothetical protein